MLPSWIRSRNERPRFRYRFAIDTTSRRLASISSRFASRTMSSAAFDRERGAAGTRRAGGRRALRAPSHAFGTFGTRQHVRAARNSSSTGAAPPRFRRRATGGSAARRDLRDRWRVRAASASICPRVLTPRRGFASFCAQAVDQCSRRRLMRLNARSTGSICSALQLAALRQQDQLGGRVALGPDPFGQRDERLHGARNVGTSPRRRSVAARFSIRSPMSTSSCALRSFALPMCCRYMRTRSTLRGRRRPEAAARLHPRRRSRTRDRFAAVQTLPAPRRRADAWAGARPDRWARCRAPQRPDRTHVPGGANRESAPVGTDPHSMSDFRREPGVNATAANAGVFLGTVIFGARLLPISWAAGSSQ